VSLPSRSSIPPGDDVELVDEVVAGAVVPEVVAGAVVVPEVVVDVAGVPGLPPGGGVVPGCSGVGGAGASSASCTAYSAGIDRSSSSGRPSLGYLATICRLMSVASALLIFAGAPCLTLVATVSWNAFK